MSKTSRKAFDTRSRFSIMHHTNVEVVKGRLAQLVERLPYKQNVGGSIPSAPTKTLTLNLVQR